MRAEQTDEFKLPVVPKKEEEEENFVWHKWHKKNV